MMHIRVADQAGGIPLEVIGRIFDPFFSPKPGKGTGLGLSISFAPVTRAGGRIGVHNQDGGAAFDIHLPLVPPRGRARAKLTKSRTPRPGIETVESAAEVTAALAQTITPCSLYAQDL